MKIKSTLIRNLSIQVKFVFCFALILIVAFGISSLIITGSFSKSLEKEVTLLGNRNLSALENYIDIIFENVTQFSNLVFVDDDIQGVLRNHRESGESTWQQFKVQNKLSTMLLSADYIHTAVLIEADRKVYKSYKNGPVTVDIEGLEDKWWFDKVWKDNEGIFVSKEDGIISYPYTPDENYITYIRSIPDKYDYSALGMLMLVINEKSLQELFYRSSDTQESVFCILDSRDSFIIRPKGFYKDYSSVKGLKDGVLLEKKLKYNDWIVSGFYPMNTVKDSKKLMRLILLIFSLVLILLGVVAVLLLRHFIFKPIAQIEDHLKMVEEGIFVTMEVPEGSNDEIITFKKASNHMIGSILELIDTIKKEEKIITKNELDIIYAQINPHFLYNTLDAASALCLIKDNDSCFRILRALGSFYRNTLNSGNDLITVEKEIESIRSYITILNIRYENRLDVSFDIPDELKEYRMLKLILQPLVENAVYHGIKEKEGSGRINIRGWLEGDRILFEVTDDGRGMSEEKISQVLNVKEDKKGFGLYSLRQRISLFYNIEEPVEIRSREGSGTSVKVNMKVVDAVGK